MSAPTAHSWTATVPRCKSCGTKDHRHEGRGLCGACYQWHARRGLLHRFPLLPVHGNGGTDSWANSQAHTVVYRNHQRRRAEARERQTRIWNTDGRFIDPASCEALAIQAPRPILPPQRRNGKRAA